MTTSGDDAVTEPLKGTGTMRAIVQQRYGSPAALQVAVIDRPQIGSDEVLIEVRAAGVDRGTLHLMTGTPYIIRIAGYGLTRPKQATPGLDVAGRVVAVGSEVTRFGPGDAVFGIARGAFAEYAAASEDKIAHKPSNLSYEEAAVAAVSGITALQALTDVGHLEKGGSVLIVGASGGVGSYATQIAKALGAHVTAVVGTRNVDMARKLGADSVIDYRRDDLVDVTERFDLVLDIGGRNSVSRLRRVLKPKGTLVIVGGEGGNRLTGGVGRQVRAVLLSPLTRQRLTMFISKEHFTFMDRLAALMASGAVKPAMGARFNLDEVPDALRRLEAGESSGKQVIVVHANSSDT